MAEGESRARGSRHPRIDRRRKATRGTRIHPGAAPCLVRGFQLRYLVLHHLDPGRRLHLVRPGLEQRWPHGDRLGLADRLDLHPDHRAVHVRAGVGVSDVGRNLLVGKQARRCEGGLLHRLAEPDRPDRDPGIGRVRRSDLPGPHARHVQSDLAQRLQPDQDVHHFRDHSGGLGDHQHLLVAPAGRHQQRLGVVACGWRGSGDPDPVPRPPAARQLLRRLRQDHQQQRHVRRRHLGLWLAAVRAADLGDPDPRSCLPCRTPMRCRRAAAPSR